ncbi:MAG: hypothetical protein K0S79_1730 [Nitrospira sp.]|nr:hypothetical protein [Nitrospira sp.]
MINEIPRTEDRVAKIDRSRGMLLHPLAEVVV